MLFLLCVSILFLGSFQTAVSVRFIRVRHWNVPAIKTKTSPHEVGGVNPNNVSRNWGSFSQPLPTRWPPDWMDYHILYMLYSAHTSITRRAVESRDIRERNSNQLSMLIHRHDTQGGGIMRWRIIRESAGFKAQANWRSNNKDT